MLGWYNFRTDKEHALKILKEIFMPKIIENLKELINIKNLLSRHL
jgi:hypothetical protein